MQNVINHTVHYTTIRQQLKHDLPLSFPQLGGISVENYKQLSVICFKMNYKWSNK